METQLPLPSIPLTPVTGLPAFPKSTNELSPKTHTELRFWARVWLPATIHESRKIKPIRKIFIKLNYEKTVKWLLDNKLPH